MSRVISRRVTRSAFAILLFSTAAMWGQEGLSTLRGTVTDKTGAVVSGTTISAREVLTNVVARTVTTDAQGNYEMPGLKTGTYQVTATLAGFKKSVTDSVVLQSNQVKRVDISLEVGELASEVLVSAAAAVIQTEQATIGANFDAAKHYGDLPIPGNAFSGTTRSWPSCLTSSASRAIGEAQDSQDRAATRFMRAKTGSKKRR